ncbi:hypothetical protein P7F88_02840 [Vibrio hannami]|uniref:hypothetical protein n=1 Tax=Vibrio hannami TaxID=2717094 RepID=UPI0024104F46|nr:hypothetical protein [Vibrio hannami]MDG3085089.1 hypothetical protein [Vibrio hannami]
MNAVKGLFRDEKGNFVVKRTPDSDYALRIMHDAKYHHDKASIMKPIDEFLHTLDKRTAAEVAEKKQKPPYTRSYSRFVSQ